MARTKAVEDVSESVLDQDASDSSVGSVGNSFAELYAKAALPFDKTFQRQIRGGRMLDYITGEQAVSRMQEVYGSYDWSIQTPAVVGTDIIVIGTLTVKIDGHQYVSRDGAGGSQIKSFGGTTDLANDFKAAETAAFKRAAAKFGVGLYLYEKDENAAPEPQYSAPASSRQAPSNLPPVAFPANKAGGNSTTGVIQAKSATGLNIEGTWYNVSKFAPVDLSPFQRGQTVTIAHAPGKTFIDGVSVAGEVDAEQEQGVDALAF